MSKFLEKFVKADWSRLHQYTDDPEMQSDTVADRIDALTDELRTLVVDHLSRGYGVQHPLESKKAFIQAAEAACKQAIVDFKAVIGHDKIYGPPTTLPPL